MKNPNNTQTTPKLSVSVEDAAQATGFSTNYLRLLISRQLLPHVRVGRAVRVLVSDLEEFLQEHRQDLRRRRPTGGEHEREGATARK